VAWLPLPELAVGEEPELRPPELELDEPELVEPELLEPELVEPELVPDELEPELADEELDEPAGVAPELLDVLVVCADPGRARASAPAVTTPAMVTAVVVDRTLARPRSLAATAWRIPSSRRALLMSFILQSRFPESLHEPSGLAMSRPGSSPRWPESGGLVLRRGCPTYEDRRTYRQTSRPGWCRAPRERMIPGIARRDGAYAPDIHGAWSRHARAQRGR
jgi:hypothetical protein